MTHESRRHAAVATLTGTGLTVAITVAQAFLLIPLCLTHLGTPLYGAWLGATEWLIWIQLLDAGIPNLLTQRVGAAIGRGDAGTAAKWSATGLLMLLATSTALVIAGLAAAPLVATWAQVPAAEHAVFTACFRVGTIASACLALSNGFVGLSRGVQRTSLVNGAQVMGALAGLATSAVLLIDGWGLWALAIGLLVRALVAVAGGVLFLWTLPYAAASWWIRPSRALAGDVVSLAPSMGGASVGYLLANNSEILLVTTLFGPVAAATYALTRRAIDGLRSLLDSITWAVYGGFAHLVTADDRHRARAVLHDVLWLRLAIACACGAVAIAVNRGFVTLLFGAEHFGGVWLTTAFAMQMVLGGQAFLANVLLRAAGEVREGSWWIVAEAVVRILAMAAGFRLAGLPGAPSAAAIVSASAWLVMLRRLDRVLPASATRVATGAFSQIAPWMILAIGLAATFMAPADSWPLLVWTGTMVGAVGLGVLWLAAPASSGAGALPRWLSSPIGR